MNCNFKQTDQNKLMNLLYNLPQTSHHKNIKMDQNLNYNIISKKKIKNHNHIISRINQLHYPKLVMNIGTLQKIHYLFKKLRIQDIIQILLWI